MILVFNLELLLDLSQYGKKIRIFVADVDLFLFHFALRHKVTKISVPQEPFQKAHKHFNYRPLFWATPLK